MISYKIENNGLMNVVFDGTIVYDDIVNWLTEFSKIEGLPEKIRLFYDLRKAILRMDMIKLIQITKKIETATSKFQMVRTAFLIEESARGTYTLLLSFLDVHGKTSRQLFTKAEKATEWLIDVVD